MNTVGIIGFGNMGEALGAGLKARSPQRSWMVLERFEAGQKKARELYGAPLASDLKELAQKCQTLVIAIKPQDMDALLADMKPLLKDHLVISLAAGVNLDHYYSLLGTRNVVRFMPNIAAKVGKALVALCHGEDLPGELQQEALEMAQALGTAAPLPEKLMAAATGISGSGIAFVFSFLHGMALGGVQSGLTYRQALEYATVTLEGAAGLLREGWDNPIELQSRVISPAGTTIEGVLALEDSAFTGTVARAVNAAAERARELG